LIPVGVAKGRLVAGKQEDALFYAWPPVTMRADSETPDKTLTTLREWSRPDSKEHWYGVEGASGPPGFVLSKEPVCRVWEYPLDVDVAD
jgi:hypothetical protein